MKSKEQLKAERLKRAQEIANLIKTGGRLPVNSDLFQNSWPARALIKKDESALKHIFGEENNASKHTPEGNNNECNADAKPRTVGLVSKDS